MGKNQELAPNLRTLLSIALAIYITGTHEMFPTANTWGLIAGGSADLFWSFRKWSPLHPQLLVHKTGS